MLLHMRTSFDIPDALLRRAKSRAARQKTTVRAIVLEGLRRVLEDEGATRAPYVLADESFGTGGVHEGVDLSDWDRIRALTYEGRGG
jgi:hypothetical protein